MIPDIETIKTLPTHRVLGLYKKLRSYARLCDWEEADADTQKWIDLAQEVKSILNSREHVPRKQRKGQNVYDVSQDKARFWERYSGRSAKRTLLRVT